MNLIKRLGIAITGLVLISSLILVATDLVKKENKRQMSERIDEIMDDIFVEADVPDKIME